MINDINRVFDAAFLGPTGGMNSGYLPEQLGKNECANAINVTFRGGGKPRTRPGFPLVKLTFETPEDQVWFERENVQAAAFYMEHVIYCIGGEIFRLKFIDKDEATVKKITPLDGRNSRFSQVWMCVAEKYLIIQDGVSLPIIVEGDTATRSTGVAAPVAVFAMIRGTGEDKLVVTVTTTSPHGFRAGNIITIRGARQKAYNGQHVIDLIDDTNFSFEILAGAPVTPATGVITALGYNGVPVGTVMAFGMGRLWVASPNRKEFVAGDISGGATDILTFSENTYLNEGGSFALPQEMGKITAMLFMSVLDSATGQGELMVFGEYGMSPVNAGIPRDKWKEVQIQRVGLQGIGATGENAVTNVNGDIFFRSNDGLRSYRSTRQEQGSWGHTPISREVGRYLDFDTPFWLQSAQVVFFDNRLLFTTSPVQWGRFAYHGGILALNFDTLSGISGKQPPGYEGVWTGIRPVTLTTGLWNGDERCYAASFDQDEVNRVYRISKTQKTDGQGVAIPCVVETGGMDFGAGYNLKEVYGADLWLSEIWDKVNFKVRYSSDRFPGWIDWKSWTTTAETKELSAGTWGKDFRSQNRPRVRLPKPGNFCDPSRQSGNLCYAYFTQARIEWTGAARIDKLRWHGQKLDEDPRGDCPEDEELGFYRSPEPDFSYNIVGAQNSVTINTGLT